ncbi:unnamed protein product [Diatraea saccharalis]|uniref:Endoplasmic reticulum metallopeptidase 1-like C-terminal domain-containing protein n=1 Tax=Diatraea saccharalis TaxID=40085 RepID=A0A9N9RG39_9NEOP|nr:unnamed protein product [Diatraea saccharalis]
MCSVYASRGVDAGGVPGGDDAGGGEWGGGGGGRGRECSTARVRRTLAVLQHARVAGPVVRRARVSCRAGSVEPRAHVPPTSARVVGGTRARGRAGGRRGAAGGGVRAATPPLRVRAAAVGATPHRSGPRCHHHKSHRRWAGMVVGGRLHGPGPADRVPLPGFPRHSCTARRPRWLLTRPYRRGDGVRGVLYGVMGVQLARAAHGGLQTSAAWAAGLCGAAACAWAVWGAGEGGGYSPRAPQRLMTFHVRRDHHHHNNHTRTETYFWVPQLDDNTLHTLNKLGHISNDISLEHRPGWVPSNTVEECERWMYCGAPYFLPVLGLVHHAHARPAPPHAHATLMLAHNATHVHGSLYRLTLHVTGPPHVVVIVSPGAGGVVEGMEGVEGGAVEGARWGERRTYFVSLYAARAHTQPRRTLHMTITLPVSDDPELCQISVSGHGMGGPLSVEQEALKQSLPDTVAHSGWPVHHHLYTINKPTATAT